MKRTEISRRSFLGMTGTSMASAMLVLAGCGRSNDTSSGSSSTAEVNESTTSSESANEPSEVAPGTASDASASGKSLIVLWSWSGNTLKMAERLSELSGAEIYRIEAADPYPEDYDATADRAKQEQDDGVYPEVANPVEDWESYDTIFMGYPIWWYELPMIVQGFVNDHDWTGKTIVPFNSHEGSGNGGTYDDLREMTGATVLDGLAIRGGDVDTSLDEVNAWYEGLANVL